MKTKYWWVYLLAAVIAINYIASLVHYRIDLTSEKRYTLTRPTLCAHEAVHLRIKIIDHPDDLTSMHYVLVEF